MPAAVRGGTLHGLLQSKPQRCWKGFLIRLDDLPLLVYSCCQVLQLSAYTMTGLRRNFVIPIACH